MGARDHLRLGPDGKYIWVENPDDAVFAEEPAKDADANVAEGADAEKAGSLRERPAAAPVGKSGDVGNGAFSGQATNPTTISSSMSGPGIGDDVAAKRASLLHAQGELKVGRRESPEPYDPWPKRKMYLKGAAGVVIVLAIVIAVILFLGADYTIA